MKEVDWLGKHKHGSGHLPGLFLDAGVTPRWQLKTPLREVTPRAVSNTGPRKLLAWCMLDTSPDQKDVLLRLTFAFFNFLKASGFVVVTKAFKIRPHRFGGEGVLIGGQTATLNA